jgi:methionyl aminopeptidase
MARLQTQELGVDVLQTRQQLANAKFTQGVVAWEFGDVQGHGVALVVWRRSADWDAGTLKNEANFTPPPSASRAEIISSMSITYKDQSGIEGMRLAGRLASEVLDFLAPHVQVGVTTNQLDQLAHDYITQVQQAIPAPLNYAPSGYKPYPKSICTSINHQVCHGIPSDKALKRGDIINIDITVIKDGWHGDTSRMYAVGEASIAAKRLCQLTYEAMWHGIVKVKPGTRLGDIGFAIQRFAEGHGFSVVREFCGHGIGQKFHEDPQVLHYGKPGTLEELQAGMTFTIEPMINAGRRDIKELGDGWTIVTRDHSLSAQWEHTILVTPTGFEVLTLSAGSPALPPFVTTTCC